MTRVEQVDDVAAAFLAALGPMDAMKLEKLVFYAQAWTAASGRGRLFNNNIEAWSQGPVVPYLFRQHRTLYLVGRWPSGEPGNLSEQTLNTVEWVVGRYGHLTGQELSALTHAETPWAAARGDLPEGAPSKALITLESMAEFYGQQILAPARAVEHAIGNVALEGLTVPEEFKGVLGEVARGERSADDVAAELVASFNART